MDKTDVAVLAVAVTIAVAAIAALWRIVEHVRAIDHAQTQARHDFRSEVCGLIVQMEDRLTRRIERLERASYGFQRRHSAGGQDDEN